jgi:hypothetical protein
MKTYDPFNWYWKVAGATTQVYSSAAGDYVPVTDPTFVAWTADGTLPTSIASAAELGEVLAPYNLRPAEAVVLDAYQDTQARRLTLEVVAKVLFNVVNEIRVLKGQPQITAAQFRTYVKGLM